MIVLIKTLKNFFFIFKLHIWIGDVRKIHSWTVFSITWYPHGVSHLLRIQWHRNPNPPLKKGMYDSILSCLYESLLKKKFPYILDAVLYFLVFVPPRTKLRGINRNHSVCSSVHPSADLCNFFLLWHWHTIFGTWMYHHETGGYP